MISRPGPCNLIELRAMVSRSRLQDQLRRVEQACLYAIAELSAVVITPTIGGAARDEATHEVGTGADRGECQSTRDGNRSQLGAREVALAGLPTAVVPPAPRHPGR